MNLQRLLSDRKKNILKNWQKEIYQLYPADSIRFLSSEKDQFANPVGHSIRENTENLFCELLAEGDITPEKYGALLDEMIRIRAVQNFSPSGALRYLYLLKEVIGRELNEVSEPDNDLYYDLVALYSRIDEIILVAFDIYSKCREKLYEIKVNTAKNQVSGLLRRSDLICEVPEWQPAQNK
ncbi:MAG: RsbRD N-terminal domain-containing protein [Deltaproteobacteria bacterium]|nr:RsbRD N-terminal domain-containing protein [Deltaproteobacteria bacterium]